MEAEIIVADDASSEELRIGTLYPQDERVTYLRFDTNQGSARIRNHLAESAHAPWLLFVDCDAAIPPAFSLRTYLAPASPSSPSSSSPPSDAAPSPSSPSSSSSPPSDTAPSPSSSSPSVAAVPSAFPEGCPVVCGGLRHPEVNPNPAATLRYKYERRADRRRSAAVRSLHPYDQLTFFSLLIRRDLFLTIRFDESCTDYGHEDTLFGAELQRRAVPILHIDTPLIHMGLESNATFLAKTETALCNLHRLAPQLHAGSRLLQTAQHLRHLHLTRSVCALYRLSRPLLRRNLLSRHPFLPLFSFYKLGYYLSL